MRTRRAAMLPALPHYTGWVLGSLAASGAGAALVAGGYLYAGLWPDSQIFGRTMVAGIDPNEVALTYDDGPNDSCTERLLDVLAGHEAHATFFLIGRFARERAALVRRIRDAGHTIGNHTWTHPKLMFHSTDRTREELTTTNATLEDILGEKIKYFRPPYGARHPGVLRAARDMDLVPVLWNVTGFDWKPIPPGDLLRKLENGIARNQQRGRGSNLLLHDGSDAGIGADRSHTIAATGALLDALRGKARFVTVAEWSEDSGCEARHSEAQRPA